MNNRSEDEEIRDLLNLKIEDLDPVDWIDEESDPQTLGGFGPILYDVPKGREGLNKLLNNPALTRLDNKIDQKSISDKAFGAAYSSKLVQMGVKERSPSYKAATQQQYEAAIAGTVKLYQRLAKGDKISAPAVANLVDSFVGTFEVDKALLLNLASWQADGVDYLFQHSVNVAILSMNIAAAAGFSRSQARDISVGGLLADIGMMAIPKSIRLKKGTLTRDDTYELHKHPILGFHLLESLPGISEVIPITAYQHHERLSGVGYPKNRQGRFINHFSRIVAIADVYEALSSQRPYRDAFMPYRCMETVLKLGSSGFLDVDHIRSFISYMSLFPIGSLVKLKSGCIAKVVEANEAEFTRPVVSVLTDTSGSSLSNDAIFQTNLSKDSSDPIIAALDSKDFPGNNVMTGF